jgi:hypothetical protein
MKPHLQGGRTLVVINPESAADAKLAREIVEQRGGPDVRCCGDIG